MNYFSRSNIVQTVIIDGQSKKERLKDIYLHKETCCLLVPLKPSCCDQCLESCDTMILLHKANAWPQLIVVSLPACRDFLTQSFCVSILFISMLFRRKPSLSVIQRQVDMNLCKSGELGMPMDQNNTYDLRSPLQSR